MENINEAPVVAGAAKVVAGMAKAGAKAAAKGAKVAAKTTKKGAKVVSKVKSTADRMAGGFDKNKDLIKNKQGLPSKKVANSGKKTVDPNKNTTIKKPEVTGGEDRPTDTRSSVDFPKPENEKKEKAKERLKKIQKIRGDKKTAAIKQGVKKTGDVVRKAGDVARKSTSAVSGAFGTSSFAKESKITFKQFIDKTP